jgi:hypothetical protein
LQVLLRWEIFCRSLGPLHYTKTKSQLLFASQFLLSIILIFVNSIVYCGIRMRVDVVRMYPSQLTPYEMYEIVNFSEIYYWGQTIYNSGKKKMNGLSDSLPNNGAFHVYFLCHEINYLLFEINGFWLDLYLILQYVS